MSFPGIWRPDLAGGYDEVTAARGPSPDHDGTVVARPDGGGPGTEVDLTGYAVEACDGPIGEVSEPGPGYLVVDIGGWIVGRRVVVPFAIVQQVDHREHRIRLDRTRQQVRNAPDHDPTDTTSADRIATYYAHP